MGSISELNLFLPLTLRETNMARPPRQVPKPAEEATDYFIIDPSAREIGGVPVEEGQAKVKLTPSAAAFAIANGTISAENPKKSAAARDAVAAATTAAEGETSADFGSGRKRRG